MSVGAIRRSSTGGATSSPVISSPRSRNRLSNAFVSATSCRAAHVSAAGSSMGSTSAKPAVAERAIGGRERARPRRRARRSSRGTRPRRGATARPARPMTRARSRRRPVLPVRQQQHVGGAESAVRDAHVVQPRDVPPHVVEHRVGDALGRDRGERDTLRLAQHEERGVIRARDAGDDDFAHGHSRRARPAATSRRGAPVAAHA